MLNKKGETPKSYAKNLKNDEGKIFLCADCDKLIRESVFIPDKCPFCGSVKISACEIIFIDVSENADGKSSNKST